MPSNPNGDVHSRIPLVVDEVRRPCPLRLVAFAFFGTSRNKQVDRKFEFENETEKQPKRN